MFSPCLSVLLVIEALFIYIVKFVNRQARQSVWCSGNVTFFLFFFFNTDGVYKICQQTQTRRHQVKESLS